MFRFPFLLIATLTWGALAFGAVYAWAYTPLLVVCVALGLVGLLAPRRDPASAGWPLIAALLTTLLVLSLPLLPLPRSLLQRVSPATHSLLRQYSFTYAQGAGVDAPFEEIAPTGIDASTNALPHPLSIEPQLTMVGVAFFVSLGLLLLGSVRFLTRQDIQTIVHGIIALSVVVAFVGLIERASFNGKIYGFWQPRFVSSPFGPFANYNHFAGWMLMALPLAVGCLCARLRRAALRDVGPRWRDRLVWLASPSASQAVLLGAASLVMALSLFLTMSRSGMTGFAVVVVILGWLMLRTQVLRSHRLVVMGYLVVLAGISIGWTGAAVVFDRFSAVKGSSLGSRLGVWQDALGVIKDFPVTGTGLNTFGIAMLFYQRHDVTSRYLQAHNDYLQLASEGGLLLAAPILATIGLFARAVRQRFRDSQADPTMYWLRVGAVTGLAAIALQETVDFSLQIPGNALLFTVLCAIALAGNRGGRPSLDTHESQHGWAH